MLSRDEQLIHAAEITAAWLANSSTRANADEVPAFLRAIFSTVCALDQPVATPVTEASAEPVTPAVSVRKSLASPDHIVSMIDGKPYRSLKRHLAKNGLTPDQYRERYGLKSDYPMVAPGYSEARRTMAKQIGLGRKPGRSTVRQANSEPDSPDGDERSAPAK